MSDMGAREGLEPLPLFVCRRQDRESVLPLFMAAVNPPAQWVTDQVLDPLAAVDLVILSGDLTMGYPTSSPPVAEGAATTKTTTKSKK